MSGLQRDAESGAALIRQIVQHGLAPHLESTRTLVGLLDGNGGFVAVNPAFDDFLGRGAGAVDVRELIAPELREYADSLFRTASRGQAIVRGRLRLVTEDDVMLCDCMIVGTDTDGFLLFAEPTTSDRQLLQEKDRLESELLAVRAALAAKTVELQAVVAQADEMAHTDSLTLLPNRRLIIADLQRQVTYAERYGTPLTISMLDLDGFKSVNDDAGHQVGDHVLGVISRELRDHIRQPDEIGRYGGDEFLVVLPNSTAAAGSEQAARLCQHVRAATISHETGAVRMTLSVGIAQFKPGSDDWRALLERADRALYEAKRAGGDQWVILEN